MEEFSSFGRDLFPYWKRICHDDEDEICGLEAEVGEARGTAWGSRAGAHQIPEEEWRS